MINVGYFGIFCGGLVTGCVLMNIFILLIVVGRILHNKRKKANGKAEDCLTENPYDV